MDGGVQQEPAWREHKASPWHCVIAHTPSPREPPWCKPAHAHALRELLLFVSRPLRMRAPRRMTTLGLSVTMRRVALRYSSYVAQEVCRGARSTKAAMSLAADSLKAKNKNG